MISSSNPCVAMLFFRISVVVLLMYPAKYANGYKIVVCKPTSQKDREDVNCNSTTPNENKTGTSIFMIYVTSQSEIQSTLTL